MMDIPDWFNSQVGSDIWWQQQVDQGVPRIQSLTDDNCLVTFLWRDPQGNEQQSDTAFVWINITGVTDHHQPNPPQSLVRLSGTDVWYWQTHLPNDWRGSYCFIPEAHGTVTEQPQSALESRSSIEKREWWRLRFPHAMQDPLNRQRSWSGGRGMAVSPLHMPGATPQKEWQAVDSGNAPQSSLTPLPWKSQRLNNQRTVWVLQIGEIDPTTPCPLTLLLDGQFWANSMPIEHPLRLLSDTGQLPAGIYAFIDIIDRAHRSRELTCNEQFWLAVQSELLPQLANHFSCQFAGERTIVAGQSFGGLSSTYACLHWPEIFANAVSASGSFWWPDREQAQGVLLNSLEKDRLPNGNRYLYLAAGRREKTIYHANQVMDQLLTQHHIAHSLHFIEGGHDALWWRGSLLAGLQDVWRYREENTAPVSPRC